jgi:hypothetical protein
MTTPNISRIIDSIPDRVARVQTGTVFKLEEEGDAANFPARLVHLSQYLNWLTPLFRLSKEDQRILGLIGANGRLLHAADAEDDELFGDAEETDAEADLVAEPGDERALSLLPTSAERFEERGSRFEAVEPDLGELVLGVEERALSVEHG